MNSGSDLGLVGAKLFILLRSVGTSVRGKVALSEDFFMNPQVYILDDDPTFAELLRANLGRAGEFKTRVFTDPADFLEATAETRPDAVLTDLHLPGRSGIEITRALRDDQPLLPIFVLTGDSDIASAIEALKAGANEYLTKPVNVTELTTLLRRALDARPLLEEAHSERARQRQRFSARALLGDHPRIVDARTFIDRVSALRATTVLLLGESGTGKNVAARAIHFSSPRPHGRFVEINCAALPGALLEAELFGYMKGAFTDARENKIGLAEHADHGTLFLDEIGELPLDVQVKLLSFLESRRFRRLGGTREIEVDLRLIAATNRDLTQAVAEGRFREDLYYRISVATHRLPALREVQSDLPMLAEQLARDLSQETARPFEGFRPEAMERLTTWTWPGNVRELRNVVERALLFSPDGWIGASSLPELGLVTRSGPTDQGAPAESPVTDQIILPRGLTLKDVEREYISRALEDHSGAIQATADSLGISRKNLWEKRKRHGLLGEP